MRIRRLVTLTFGAALGAGAVYLFDPEHGQERRRHARRAALTQARSGAGHAVRNLRARAEEVTLAAVAGFQASRAEADVPPRDGGR